MFKGRNTIARDGEGRNAAKEGGDFKVAGRQLTEATNFMEAEVGVQLAIDMLRHAEDAIFLSRDAILVMYDGVIDDRKEEVFVAGGKEGG